MKEIKQSSYLYESINDPHMKQRVTNSLNWYIKMSVIYKRCYYTFYSISIIAPLLVTILNSFDSEFYIENNLKIVSVVLATITTVATSLLALYRFKDKWQTYRATCEEIKSELMKFNLRVGPYTKGNVAQLCDEIEHIISDTSNKIVQIVNSADEESKKIQESNK